MTTIPSPPPSNVTLNASAAKAAYLLAVHDSSVDYTIAYVCVVLILYTVGLSALLMRNARWNGHNRRLAVFYHAFAGRSTSVRQRRVGAAARLAKTAPQVVVHEPEVSSSPLRGAAVTDGPGNSAKRARQQQQVVRPVCQVESGDRLVNGASSYHETHF